MLKSYVTLVQDTKKKNDSPAAKNDSTNTLMMLPNQKYIKIVVGPQNQNTFQNVFLNIVPTAVNSASSENKSKDTNQNVFLNINDTFQKFIPIASSDQKSVNVTELLTESTSEELSVEIDPTDLDLGPSSDMEDDECDNGNDWEDLISTSQILSKTNGGLAMLNGNQKLELSKASMYGNFVPILPKQSPDDFSKSGEHFLSSQLYAGDFPCERCQRHFTTLKLLQTHVQEFHQRKMPFRCNFCHTEFYLRSQYEICFRSHKEESVQLPTTSLTLKDFNQDKSVIDLTPTAKELESLTCEICNRQFNGAAGLLRHKVRKHNQKAKKKYFIKGMKNARCDICNREFSTQSYMQLHRKLHLRDDIGYKCKVFGRSRYQKNFESGGEKNSDEDEGNKTDDNQEGKMESIIIDKDDSDS